MPEHVDRNSSARIPVPADAQPLRAHFIEQAHPDPDGHIFVEAVVIAEAAKKQLQKQIDDEKDKKELQKISPDLSEPEAQDTFQDKWSRGIEWLTGKKIPDPKEMDKIRVPESVNTELKDILWLAGRTKK